jgi:hypothetical protein
MEALLRKTDLATVGGWNDVPSRCREVVAEGWIRDAEGAVLLCALLRSYHGRRSAFIDVRSYEAAVNGRAVPDMDLPVMGPQRVEMLIRRSYFFACGALSQLRKMADPPQVTAFIVINRTDTEDPVYVGTVTFWARHEGEKPYFELSDNDPDDAMMSIESADCGQL